jgi:hypothetical protein
MSDIKVLMVREYFCSGVIQPEMTSSLVLQIPEGKDLGIGFASIANVAGIPKFRMLQKFDGKIQVTSELSVSQTSLNGKPVRDVGEWLFGFGDLVEVYATYKDPGLVSRDTVVLVPDRTPAQQYIDID